MKSLFSVIVFAIASIVGMGNCGHAGTITFGHGINQFNIEFVTIGDPDNDPDSTGAPTPAGSVGYIYGIAKYEVSEDMINKFNGSQSFFISTFPRGPNKPATSLTWNYAARFVNWLNTSSGGHEAYNFLGNGDSENIIPWTASDSLDYDSKNPFRSKRARYVLPSFDEWYKAAFFNPGTNTYSNYSNGSDTPPDPVANGPTGAVYLQPFDQGPADVNQAGGPSPYGVVGLGGNVYEWEESTFDVTQGNYNSSGSAARAFRGGYWNNDPSPLNSSSRFSGGPNDRANTVGFRVAMVTPSGGQVPEPSTMAIFSLGALGMVYRARRKTKA